MGLAASQARLLTITARLSDNELRSQTINNAKMRLATQSSQASDEYVTALNNAQLMFINNDADGISRQQALTFNSLTAYSQYNNQYGLVNSAGLLLVSEHDANLFKQSNGDLNKFLEAHGLEWGTTYFGVNEAELASKTLSTKLASIYGTGTNSLGTNNLGVLFVGMKNEDLMDLYLRGTSEEASIERINYDNIASRYYNELNSLYESIIPDIRVSVLGDSTSGLTEDSIAYGLADYKNRFGAGTADKKVQDHLINGTGSLRNSSKNTNGTFTEGTGTLTNDGSQYCLKTLSDNGLITDTAKNAISDWVKSITDDVNTDSGKAGFADYTWHYQAPTAITGSYDAWDSVNKKVIQKTANEGDLGYKFEIGGLEITIDDKKESDGYVWKRTNEGVTEYEKTNSNTTPPAGEGWTLYKEVFKIGTDKKTTLKQTEGDSDETTGDAWGTAIYDSLPTVSSYHLANFQSPNIDTTLNAIASAMSAHNQEDTDILCIYKYINSSGVDGKGSFVRITMGDNRENVYEFAAKEYFSMVFDCVSNINWETFAENNQGLASLQPYKEVLKNFQLYDSVPVIGEDNQPVGKGNGNLEKLVKEHTQFLKNFTAMLEDQGTNIYNLGSDAFKSVLDTYLVDIMIDALGEPKYAWIDANDPTATENADSKAQWYTNLFNRMQRGYKVLENGLASSREWIEYAFEAGIVTMEQVDKSYNWLSLDYKTCANIYEDSDNSDAVAKAEAKYNRAMNDIKQKDSIYDLQLKNIDTEHQSLQTEYDSIKTVINKNIERTMKFDQSA